ncbi:hypothetical protein [Candidatus Cyrtobacter comes]|nr:hypothetical protein [Candidatus Cyrtobacter comes]
MSILPLNLQNLIPTEIMNEMNRVIGGYKPTPRYVPEIDFQKEYWGYDTYQEFEQHRVECINKLAAVAAEGDLEKVDKMVGDINISSNPKESERARDSVLLGLLEKDIDKIDNAAVKQKNDDMQHDNILHRACLVGSLGLLERYAEMQQRRVFDASSYLSRRNHDGMDLFQCATKCRDQDVMNKMLTCLRAMEKFSKIIGPHTEHVMNDAAAGITSARVM